MSVAFRRDGDEEHLEPKFAIPIPAGPNLVTPRGQRQIDGRVAELEAALASAFAAAADETATAAINRDLRYWQQRQMTAQIPPPPAGDTVEFGTAVTFALNGKESTMAIVGTDEADARHGLMSFTAPIARALAGAQAGDRVAFNGREDAIEVLAVAVAAG
ncbi:MAG: hypothetical protein RLZZ08_1132 [Pseudomonadota bacterium]|jgi:transcription elongation GreA/GreB family factor